MVFEFNEKKWKKINSFFGMDTLKIAIMYVVLTALLCVVLSIATGSVQNLNVVFLDLVAGVVLFYLKWHTRYIRRNTNAEERKRTGQVF